MKKRISKELSAAVLCFLFIVFVEIPILILVIHEPAKAITPRIHTPPEKELKEFVIVIEREEEEVTPTIEEIIIEVQEEPVQNTVQGASSFKSWTNYQLLSPNSSQGLLQTRAYTDEYGLRKVEDYYCVAMGTYYSNTIGETFLITLDTGVTFKAIICDVKSDIHTNETNQYTKSNGCMIEFYVDTELLYELARRMGDCSYIPGFSGMVINVEKIV